MRRHLGADQGKPALSRLAGARSSRHKGTRLGVVKLVFIFLRDILDVYECKDRFEFNVNTNAGILFPGGADLSRLRGCELEAEQTSVGTSATGHGLHLSARATGLTALKLAPRGEGGMHRSGSMHEPPPGQSKVWGQSDISWVGFKDI